MFFSISTLCPTSFLNILLYYRKVTIHSGKNLKCREIINMIRRTTDWPKSISADFNKDVLPIDKIGNLRRSDESGDPDWRIRWNTKASIIPSEESCFGPTGWRAPANLWTQLEGEKQKVSIATPGKGRTVSIQRERKKM